MAKSNNLTVLFVLLLSLLLIVTIVESRPVFQIGQVKAQSAVSCEQVVGVNSGDTCFDIAKSFGLSTAQFDDINPNINCAAIFVGQWVCVSGTA